MPPMTCTKLPEVPSEVPSEVPPSPSAWVEQRNAAYVFDKPSYRLQLPVLAVKL